MLDPKNSFASDRKNGDAFCASARQFPAKKSLAPVAHDSIVKRQYASGQMAKYRCRAVFMKTMHLLMLIFVVRADY
jgi:hypothetical protein